MIMNTSGQNVNAVADLVFDMLHSDFRATGKSSAFYTIPS